MAVPTSAAPARRQALLHRYFNQEVRMAWLFVLPALIGLTVFILVPTVRAFIYSFSDWNLLQPPKFIGMANYKELFQDEQFIRSLKVTVYYVLLNIPLQTVLALALAALMDRLTESVFVRGVIVLPYLLSNVIVAMVWLWLLDPQLGFVNNVLHWFSIPGQKFLGSTAQAMPAVAGINIWRHVGYTALILFAGLKAIPKDVYEAASIDGASEWKMFVRITLPLLRPVLAFVLITSVIGSFQIFDTISVTTKGGPAGSTRVIFWYIYEMAFTRFRMGYATTLAVALFLILMVITLLQWKFLRTNQSDLERG